jgi:hypothetical protein
MKTSNLALRLDRDEARAAAESATEAGEAERRGPAEQTRFRQPRRSLDSRVIVIRDQGFAPFRVR